MASSLFLPIIKLTLLINKITHLNKHSNNQKKKKKIILSFYYYYYYFRY